MRVFIAEKPSVARAIATGLGGGHREKGFIACDADVVTWCFGHMLEQAQPDAYTPDDVPRTRSGKKVWRNEELPIVPERWRLVGKRGAQEQLKIIGRLVRKASVVVHAGDPDREGQLLVDEVLEHLGYRREVRRFWVSAQDPVSIRRGLDNLRSNVDFTPLADAARARQRADWLIGMNLSRAYTLRAQADGSDVLLTVGRVQTPTLSLVVSRDRAVEAFVSASYCTVEATLQHVTGAFAATYKPGRNQDGLDSEGRIVDAAVADAVAQAVTGKKGTVQSFHTDKKEEGPPLPFSLSDLTVLASKRFGYTAEEVLEGCQSLYENHQLISYPRTDVGYLPVSQHADAPAVLEAVAQTSSELQALVHSARPKRRAPCWNDAKVTAHHGIIPTMTGTADKRLSERERDLYELIARRYVEQFYPAHSYLRSEVNVEIAGHEFRATGKVTIDPGWRACEPKDDRQDRKKEEADDGGERHEQVLPQMARGDDVVVAEAVRRDRKTKAPPRFTEGSLVRAMEQIHREIADPELKKVLRDGDGIGTAATRAAIISELKRRGFLAARGKHIVSTELGRSLVDALPASVQSPVLTALYERTLGEIEAGRATVEEFVQEQAAFVTERVLEAKRTPLNLSPPAQARRIAARSHGEARA